MGYTPNVGSGTNRPFVLDLDINRIQDGIYHYERYIDAVIRGIEKGEKELADRLEDKLIDNLILYGLLDTSIVNDIRVKVAGNGISLSVGSKFALYVEYGTGIVGANNSHPSPKGWVYDVNSHGEQGWMYPTNESDPNPTKKMHDGQWYAWTKGQKSKPFMYNTWLWGRRSATQIIRKNMRAEIKKVKGIK